MSVERTWARMLAGASNVRFADFEKVVLSFGCIHRRTSGSHRVFVHPRVPRPLSFQPVGKDAKPYQIRQFVRTVEEFGLTMGSTR